MADVHSLQKENRWLERQEARGGRRGKGGGKRGADVALSVSSCGIRISVDMSTHQCRYWSFNSDLYVPARVSTLSFNILRNTCYMAIWWPYVDEIMGWPLALHHHTFFFGLEGLQYCPLQQMAPLENPHVTYAALHGFSHIFASLLDHRSIFSLFHFATRPLAFRGLNERTITMVTIDINIIAMCLKLRRYFDIYFVFSIQCSEVTFFFFSRFTSCAALCWHTFIQHPSPEWQKKKKIFATLHHARRLTSLWILRLCSPTLSVTVGLHCTTAHAPITMESEKVQIFSHENNFFFF